MPGMAGCSQARVRAGSAKTHPKYERVHVAGWCFAAHAKLVETRPRVPAARQNRNAKHQKPDSLRLRLPSFRLEMLPREQLFHVARQASCAGRRKSIILAQLRDKLPPTFSFCRASPRRAHIYHSPEGEANKAAGDPQVSDMHNVEASVCGGGLGGPPFPPDSHDQPVASITPGTRGI